MACAVDLGLLELDVRDESKSRSEGLPGIVEEDLISIAFPADLRFEVRGQNGQNRSRNDSPSPR